MQMQTPTQICQQAMKLRVYLRNSFYPNNQSVVTDNIYNTIQNIIDIDQYDPVHYKVKCKRKKISSIDECYYTFYLQLNNMISTLFNMSSLGYYIDNDGSLSDKDKNSMILVCTNIAQNALSEYLKYMFSCNVLGLTGTSVSIALEL